MGPDGLKVEVELAADAEAAQRARSCVDRVTAPLPEDVGFRARLAVSELVANSVAHAAGSADERVGLTVLRMRTSVRVEVRDRGAPFDTEVRVVSERATSGRGLQLVDALADRWGADHDDGNLVWFEIDQQRPGPGSEPPRLQA